MRRTEIAGELQAMFVQVNCDDWIAAGDLRCHQGRQSDCPDTEYGDAVSCVWLHDIEHCTGAGLSAACEGAKQLQRSVRSNLHGEAFISYREGAERRLLEERAMNGHLSLLDER